MLFTNRDARRIACRQLGNDITLEVTKHLLARSFDRPFDVSSHGRITATRKRASAQADTRGWNSNTQAGRKDGGKEGKTRTRRRELHPALRPDAAKQARAGVNNALRRGSAISGHVPVRDFLSSAYKACGRRRAVWQELGRVQSLEELVIGNFIAISCTPCGVTFQEWKEGGSAYLLHLYSSLMIESHIRASRRLTLLRCPREIWHELTLIKFCNINFSTQDS